MIHLAHFEVMGVPAPQGSKTRMPNGAMVEGGSATGRAKHKAWRSAVADVARQLAEPEPFDGALALLIGFRMPMPVSRPARAREVGVWPHTVKPDIDKLIRCTLDGLTDGGLIRDDARVFKLEVFAMEVIGWTGADITLQRWEN
jgi:Holliday junction resolvase RusA-like endonuclease